MTRRDDQHRHGREIAGRGCSRLPAVRPAVRRLPAASSRPGSLGRRGLLQSYDQHGSCRRSTAATPYILFKCNTTATQAVTSSAKMFHLYNLNRDEYLSHYHKRSNVETTYMMIKSKFGDHVCGRRPTPRWSTRLSARCSVTTSAASSNRPTNSGSRRRSGARSLWSRLLSGELEDQADSIEAWAWM